MKATYKFAYGANPDTEYLPIDIYAESIEEAMEFISARVSDGAIRDVEIGDDEWEMDIVVLCVETQQQWTGTVNVEFNSIVNKDMKSIEISGVTHTYSPVQHIDVDQMLIDEIIGDNNDVQ